VDERNLFSLFWYLKTIIFFFILFKFFIVFKIWRGWKKNHKTCLSKVDKKITYFCSVRIYSQNGFTLLGNLLLAIQKKKHIMFIICTNDTNKVENYARKEVNFRHYSDLHVTRKLHSKYAIAWYIPISIPSSIIYFSFIFWFHCVLRMSSNIISFSHC
jgi:hypothetical protein